ncbi:hypothetical protein [Streptomyces sp. NPDC086787]|uniref:hypothetical protein n=1 Tax=Streptomyces sp. NPDC086787 TaxID=3365759 RepID=UPI0037FD12E8
MSLAERERHGRVASLSFLDTDDDAPEPGAPVICHTAHHDAPGSPLVPPRPG